MGVGGMTVEEEFLQEFYDIKLSEKSCATCNYYMTPSYCDADPVCKERSKWSKIAITDKKQAVEYILSLELEKGNKTLQTREVIEAMFQAYVGGLKKGRQQKWHELRKNPDDLPKENKEYLVAYKNFLNQEETVVEICNWNIYKFVDDEYNDIPWFKYKDVLIAWSEIPKFEE